MPKIDKLIYRTLIPPFLIALSVLTFVAFIRDIGRLSELLVTRNASPAVIGMIAGAILPPILVFSLPLSFLIGNLIGLSGLSGENQITALRACGVPLWKLLRPVLLIGTIVGLLTGLISIKILPEANGLFHRIKDKISLRQATSQIQPRVFNENFNMVLYLDDLSTDRQKLSRVFLADNSDPKSPRTVIAREGSWITDAAGTRLQLHLEDGTIYEVDPENPNKDKFSVFASTDIPIAFNTPAGQGAEGSPDSAKPKTRFEMSTIELWHNSTLPEQLDLAIELHRRLAIPFSVFAFALVGLTLGVNTKKGGRTSGFVISLFLVLFFYVTFMNGLRLASVNKVPPWLGAWGANILLGLVGTCLLLTAERTSRIGQIISGWRWPTTRPSLSTLPAPKPTGTVEAKIRQIDSLLSTSAIGLARLRFPKVLDLYISKGYIAYFLWSVLVCGFLFVILTLFDLLDDIIRNRIPIIDVFNYFFFFSPQILMLVVPMAVLLAILINFGILEKHSEITALKAGGWSLYRISIPIFLISAALSVNLYFLQDYVLPYANIKQDSLRNIIKGRPAQTSMRPQRKWIFGESNRVFNYNYFDANQNVFVGLDVYEIDLRNLKMLRRIHAARASVDTEGKWVLENGWVRNFQAKTLGFQRIEKSIFPFPEKSSYFQKEILQPKESSKLTYLELKDYINYLKKAGYNATELQVELYKKLSFPLSCVVMSLIGIPFSFSMGRKGAFFGIAISLAIAMSYWGVFGVFEQMGSYGFLNALLAACAPNILFAAAGLILLFTIRT